MQRNVAVILVFFLNMAFYAVSMGQHRDHINDTIAPPMPKLDSVSIDFISHDVLVGWDTSSAEDVVKYFIYHDGNINSKHDSVEGRFNTFYRDTSFDACSMSMAYAISAQDSAGNVGPGTYDNLAHRTIHLEEVDFNPCTMVNKLIWSQYLNMNPPLEGYRIYLSVDTNQFELHTIVYDSITEYEHVDLEPGRTYRYLVRAFNADYSVTSSSCIRTLNTWQYRRPSENSIENISVENSSYVGLSFLPDTFAAVPYLVVYRSEENSGPWILIDTVELQGQDMVYYDDETADVNSNSYYYYTTLIDSCGNEVLESDLFRTILLQGTSNNQINMLEWNAFEGWPGGVETYQVYRAIGDGGYSLLAEENNSILSYNDDISSLTSDFVSLRYIVRATNDAGETLLSWSNEISIEYTPKVILPNAFKPGGNNPEFKPVAAHTDFIEYRMDVYNRWGELVFSSYDFGLGWDGTIKGSDAPAGVYVCILNYKSAGRENTTLKTTFVLIR